MTSTFWFWSLLTTINLVLMFFAHGLIERAKDLIADARRINAETMDFLAQTTTSRK